MPIDGLWSNSPIWIKPQWLGGLKTWGRLSAAHPGHIEFPRRYATSALKGKVLGWFRKHPGNEIAVGLGPELEQWVGLDPRAQLTMERTVLFEAIENKAKRKGQADPRVAAARHHQPSRCGGSSRNEV